MKILFIHGYKSSPETNKFKAIRTDDLKVCLHVDYDALSHDEVEELYFNHINKYTKYCVNPAYDVIVGHSLGGYWALKMSSMFGIPCVLLNPQMKPKLDGYPELFASVGLLNNAGVFSYVETGDEVIDVPRTVSVLAEHTDLTVHGGGHHRVENLEMINTLIGKAINYEPI